MTEEKKKRKLIDRLKVKYRMVLLNDDSFAEKFSFRLTALNVFIAVGVISFIMIALVTSVIAFTPLREFIPGYASEIATKRDLIALSPGKCISTTLTICLTGKQPLSLKKTEPIPPKSTRR